MEKKNREQRRREKFGHTGGATKEPWPQSEANPVFSHGGPADDTERATGDRAAHTVEPDDETPSKTEPAPGNQSTEAPDEADPESASAGTAKG